MDALRLAVKAALTELAGSPNFAAAVAAGPTGLGCAASGGVAPGPKAPPLNAAAAVKLPAEATSAPAKGAPPSSSNASSPSPHRARPLFADEAAARAIVPPAKIAMGADHGGVELKDFLRDALRQKGFTIIDLGTHGSEAVDYPDFAFKVADLVARGEVAVGIMVDGVGIGSCMTANKVPGVRAAPCYETFSAKNSREHNAANVLCLGGRVTGQALATEIVNLWLGTAFGGDRHLKRVDKILGVEGRYLRA